MSGWVSLWHRHMSDSDSSAELGSKYRSLLAACAVGPVDPSVSDKKMGPAGVGASELGESDQQYIKKAQEQLMTLRRQSVGFLPLQAVGASGAQYSLAQLNKTWEQTRLGHQFSKKKGDRRALIFSADLFPQKT